MFRKFSYVIALLIIVTLLRSAHSNYRTCGDSCSRATNCAT